MPLRFNFCGLSAFGKPRGQIRLRLIKLRNPLRRVNGTNTGIRLAPGNEGRADQDIRIKNDHRSARALLFEQRIQGRLRQPASTRFGL